MTATAYMSQRFEGTSDNLEDWHVLHDYFLAYFECHVCNLRLEGAELDAFSYEREITLVLKDGEYVRYEADRETKTTN